jgi:NAD(P)-dependent dehydrogenase (short-subunit alcohol dehydrogenase family)
LSIFCFRDVRSPESAKKIVEETVKAFGKIDILINGAAGNFLCPAEDLSTNAFKTGNNLISTEHSRLTLLL